MKLITQELALKDVYPELMAGLKIKHGIADDAVFVRKGIVPDDLKFDEGERSAISYITTVAVDRDGEIVDPNGCIVKDYMTNPVVLFGHDHKGMPIGKCAWIKADAKGLIAKTIYANTTQANEIYEYRKAGFPLAQSIGFIPLERMRYEPGSPEAEKGINCKYTKWLLLEYSDVPVPSNPEALMIAVSKGLLPLDQAKDFTIVLEDDPIIKEPDILVDDMVTIPDELEKIYSALALEERNDFIQACKDFIAITKPGWDETEDQFRFRVKDPGLFRDDTFRTVPLKKDKPRVNSVMGKLKKNEGKPEDPMTIQNIMFPKADDWTLATAKEWVAAHRDLLKSIENTIELIAVSIEEKSGRVLSGKNRETITTAVGAMGSATTALNELLMATEPSAGNEGKDTKDYLNLELVPIADDTKAIEFKAEDISAMIKTQVDAAIKKSVIPAIVEAAKSAIRTKQGKLD